MIQNFCNSVRLVSAFCIICYCHGIRLSEGYDKEEKEKKEISGGGQGKDGLKRVTWVRPGDSTQQHSWESLGQETLTLFQPGLFCSCRNDFISAQHRMQITRYMSSVSQLCLTLCESVDYRLLCTWDFQGKNTAVGCHFPLQGIFLTHRSNLHLLHLLH